MENILSDFCKGWNTFDASLLIKHLDDSFVYDSQWVFSSLDHNGYVEYIQNKFRTLKNKGIVISASIVSDPYLDGKMLKLTQEENISYYRIKVVENKVVKGDLCMF